jgi:hypothetical protein
LPLAKKWNLPIADPRQDFVVESHLGGGLNSKGDPLLIEYRLKIGCGLTYADGAILISPRMHVGSDDRLTNARGYGMARELQSRFKCFGTVVDPGKQMTMKIDHACLDEYPLL